MIFSCLIDDSIQLFHLENIIEKLLPNKELSDFIFNADYTIGKMEYFCDKNGFTKHLDRFNEKLIIAGNNLSISYTGKCLVS